MFGFQRCCVIISFMIQKMRRILKVLTVISLVSFLATFLFLISVNNWILPHLFQKFAKEYLWGNLSMDVSCGGFYYSLERGLVVRELVLERQRPGQKLFFSIQQLQFKISWKKLFRRQIYIRDFKLSNVQYSFEKEGAKPFTVDLKEMRGSLKHEKKRNVGLKGWRGKIEVESLKLPNSFLEFKSASLLIEDDVLKMVFGTFARRDRTLRFQGKFLLEKGFVKWGDLRMSDRGCSLFAMYNGQGVNLALFGRKTVLMGYWDLSRGFKKGAMHFKGPVAPAEIDLILEDLLKFSKNKIYWRNKVFLDGIWYGRGAGQFSLWTDKAQYHFMPLRYVKLDLGFDRKGLLFKSLRAKSCFGFLSGWGWKGLPQKKDFGVTAVLERADLQCLSRVLFSKDQRVDGSIEGSTNFMCRFPLGSDVTKPSWDMMKLAGDFRVYDGNLWNIRVMSGILGIFEKMFPGLGNIQFTSGSVNYWMEGGMLYVDQLRLVSSVLVMEGSGKMNLLNQKIDGHMAVSLNLTGPKDKTLVSKIISTGLMTVGEQLWKVKIRGTMKNPEFEPEFLSVLEPVKDLLKAIFGG